MTSLCYWYSESMTRLKQNWTLLAYHVTINKSEDITWCFGGAVGSVVRAPDS